MAADEPGTAQGNQASSGPQRETAPLALYRKYRPATFAELKGQEQVTEPLSQALRSGRVHHAYLFSGPRGCGKTSSARILARSLNCEQGPTPEPCGVCASCVALAPSGPGSIDVIEIDAASHGGVDDARDLRERAFYAPVSGRFKIYIIDEAHMVTREGFNALLKLVEEPPPHLKFVFATTEPDKVIATIRSRTHHYPFRLVPPAVLRELLQEILQAEQVTYEPSVLPLVVRAGAGSARDSLSVLDQLIAGSDSEGLTYERTVALLGYTDDRLLDEVVDAFAAGDGAAVFTAVDRVVEGGHDPRRFAADLLDRFRDLIILAAVPGAGRSGLLDAPEDRLERMAEQARRFGQADLARAAELLSAGLIQMRGATSPRLLLELMCAQVLLPSAHTDEKSLLARVERLESLQPRTGFAPSPPADTPAPSPAAPSGPSPAAPSAVPSAPAAARPSAPAAARPPAPVPGRPPAPPRGSPAARPPAPSPAAGGQPAGAGPAGGTRASAGGPGRAGTRPPGGAERSAGRSAPAVLDAELLREHWPDILEAVKGERKVAWILLRPAAVQSLENGTLTVAFPREGEARGFASSGHDQALVTVLQAMFGLSVHVRAVVAGPPDTPQASAPAPRPRASAAARADVPPHPGGPAAPDSRPVPLAAAPADDEPWPEDPEDAAARDDGADGLTGMDLIRRQLGGEIIEEIDEG